MNNLEKFTDYKEDWIEAIISRHMEVICHEILKKIEKVDSIILVGGFGRGEGTIKIIGKEELIPLKDYDLVVVSNYDISERNYLSIISNIHKVLKIPIDWYDGAAPGYFHINIKLVRKRNLVRLPPDISNYELKKSSRILYGSDLRQLIPIKKEDINYSSGLRILLNKIIGLLEYFPSDPSLFHNNTSLKESCIYECGKTYIEIGTALTILMGCYEATYKERASNFEKQYEKKLPFLSKLIPDLNNNIKKFTDLKLRPNYDQIDINPVDLWYSTSRDLINVIIYYFEYIIKKKISNPTNFMREFPKFLELNYFSPFINYYFKKFKCQNRFFVYFGSFLIQIYENLRYLKSLLSHKNILLLKNLFSKKSPIIKIHCVALFVLFSIIKNEYKEEFIKNACNLLKQIYPIKNQHKTMESKLNSIRIACIEVYKLYQLKKITKSTF